MEQSLMQKDLFDLADKKYKEFHSSLCPGTDNIIGVRVPRLREYAKKIYKTENLEEILNLKPVYYEEKMIQGMVIGFNTKEPLSKIQSEIEKFVPEIDNWAICDVFTSGLKITKKYPKEMWNFIQKYFKSNREFELRFAIVMLINYYIIDDYIDKVLNVLDNIKNDFYYVKMAIAWAISICYIKYPMKTKQYLKHNRLDDFTHNKAIQKIRESYRVTKEEKEEVIKLRR